MDNGGKNNPPKTKEKYNVISSLLTLSDYKRIGLPLTLKKAMNEVLHRENIKRNKKRKKELTVALLEEYLKKCDREFGDFAEAVGISCGNSDIIPASQRKDKKAHEKNRVHHDFCRDFYTSALVWVLEEERENDPICAQFRKAAEDAGHLCLSPDEAEQCGNATWYSGFCYVYFGNGGNMGCNDIDVNFSGRILVSESPRDAKYADVIIKISDKEKADEQDGISLFCAPTGGDAFRLSNGKIKSLILSDMEKAVNPKATRKKKISVIVCTYRRGEKLADMLRTVANQSMDKTDYEIIVVDNSPLTETAREYVEGVMAEYAPSGDFIRYMGEPRKGLSYARNCGMRNADGEYLLFIDDDALADYNLLEEMCRSFEEHPCAGIVGGQVILDIPEPAPEVIREGNENIWSQFIIHGNSYRKTTRQFEFPYGANLGVRSSAIGQIGGFRQCYGRVGNNFDGGEEIALAFQMLKLGFEIGLQPRAKVTHHVDESRFSREHVKNTIRAGIFSCHRFFRNLHSDTGWTKRYVENQIKIVNKEIELFKKKKAKPIDIFYKECYLETWKELLNFME